MDITVTAIPDENSWGLSDLFGRNLGHITETKPGTFMIHPAGTAAETLAAIISQRYASLDRALAAIEEHTRGACHLARK